MSKTTPGPVGPESHLSRISTKWPLLGDVSRFALRYGPALRAYIHSIVRDAQDAEEVAQDFFVTVLQNGFAHASPDRGRFRDYLKVAARNATFTWLARRRRAEERLAKLPPAEVAGDTPAAADEAWIAEWRKCILERAWQALDDSERKGDAGRFYTVLRLTIDHPEEDSARLAARVELPEGGTMRPDAFRKQVSRARRFFADLVAKEVAATIEDPTRERVEEELVEVGLLEYVRGYLSPTA